MLRAALQIVAGIAASGGMGRCRLIGLLAIQTAVAATDAVQFQAQGATTSDAPLLECAIG